MKGSLYHLLFSNLFSTSWMAQLINSAYYTHRHVGLKIHLTCLRSTTVSSAGNTASSGIADVRVGALFT